MQFNSFAFLGFFAIVAAAYYLLPHRWRWLLLLGVSYYFYSSFSAPYLLLLAYATLVAWGFGRAVAAHPSRLVLAAGIVLQLAVLVALKYADFLAGAAESALGLALPRDPPLALPRLDWLLPVGLSFYTFSCVSYLVDVRRGVIAAEPHLGRLALYVAFFPKLIAGPIERAGPFLAQLDRPVRFDPALVAFGLQLFLWGLFKKVVIADRLAAFVDTAYATPAFQSPVNLTIAVYFYAFQIYCDFSGYSDMAIGAAAVLGIRLMENFRRPYLSRSVPEFWSRRWHISLMAWFRDYLYIPLGGNRVARPRWYLNIMAVFAVSGLWHGAGLGFLVWGLLNGAYQVVHLMTGRLRGWLAARLAAVVWNGLAIALTFHLILLSWIFFRAETIGQAWLVITRLVGALPMLPQLLATYSWPDAVLLSIGLILLLIAVEVLDEVCKIWDWLDRRPAVLRWGVNYALLGALLVIGEWGMARFVYMQF